MKVEGPTPGQGYETICDPSDITKGTSHEKPWVNVSVCLSESE